MDEIGNILREARETKGLTYTEIHEKLRISTKFLRALEEGRYDLLPSQTHVRGYLRKYSRLLSLDAEPLLERYEAIKDRPIPVQPPPPPTKPVAAPLQDLPDLPPEPETGTFFNPINTNLYQEPEESAWVGRLIIIALIACITLLGWRFSPLLLGNLPDGISNTAVGEIITAQATESAQVDPTAIPLQEQASEDSADNGTISTQELIVSTSRTGDGSAAASEAETPEPTPTRNPLPATLDIIDIQIDITERAWMRVTVDDITLFEGQARRGDVQNYTANDSVTIRTGNGAGIFVTINDIEIGRLGEREQVVDQTWETTQ